MAYRFGEHITWGLIDNRRRNTTRGMLHFWGEPQVALDFTLTGDCSPDLRGKLVRFWCRQDPWECKPLDPALCKGFHWRQIGATGQMTASGWVKSMPCSGEEFMRRAALGEPPPTPWVRRLYLEWYGQNGCVVIEMADPLVEQCPFTDEIDDRPLSRDELWAPLPNLAMMPAAALKDSPPAGLGITQISRDEDGTLIKHWSKVTDEWVVELDDEEAQVLENGRPEEEESDEDFMAELELMDDCLEHGGTPLLDLLGDMGVPPAEDCLDDEALSTQLKLIIGRLAQFNVAFDVCEHFTEREAYRLLTEEILPEEYGYPEMAGTEWIQHYSTHEFCATCDEEAERAYENYKDRDPDNPEEDVPF